MGLDYHFSFKADDCTLPQTLESFLERVRSTATEALGFKPCKVLAVPFDTPERLEFARLLTSGEVIQNDAFKGVDVSGVYQFNREAGEVRLLPEEGVFLVVTDNRGGEIVFGFYRYPEGVGVVPTGLSGWRFRGHVTSPDPRYRTIVRMFGNAGYLDEENDEYA